MRAILGVTLSAALAAAVLVMAQGAAATQVAYSDGDQVWVSTLDGSAKRSLSGPSANERQWQEVAQADDGTIIGVHREAGKISQLNDTQVWKPDGSVSGYGALTGKLGRSFYAYPVTLDLTPDGGSLVYGYSNTFGANASFEFGTYAANSTNSYGEPIDITAVDSGTLAGRRIVGVSGTTVSVQNESSGNPYNTDFTPWFDAGGISSEVGSVDVSANGKIVAIETGPLAAQRIAMIPFASLGGPLPADGSDCFLPTVGAARDVSISQDGTSMAWHDDRGVVVAGTPMWFPSLAESTCNLSRSPVVISATGKYPSLGASTAATPAAPPTGGGGGGGTTTTTTTPPPTTTTPGPKVTVSSTVKASSLAAGLPLAVTVTRAGTVTVTAKVGKATVATASGKAKKAGTLKLRLTATKAYRKRLRSLRGKTLVITIKAGGRTTTLKRKLK